MLVEQSICDLTRRAGDHATRYMSRAYRPQADNSIEEMTKHIHRNNARVIPGGRSYQRYVTVLMQVQIRAPSASAGAVRGRYGRPASPAGFSRVNHRFGRITPSGAEAVVILSIESDVVREKQTYPTRLRSGLGSDVFW